MDGVHRVTNGGATRESMRPSEPLGRGIILHAYREAAVATWGAAGLEAIARALPDEVRRATVEQAIVTLEWHPARWIMAWHQAVFDGPAGRDDSVYCAYIDRTMDRGFGLLRRALLKFTTPSQIVRRGSELWRHQHTHGQLVVTDDSSDERTIRGELRDHPFVGKAISRRTIAETVRYALALSGAKDARETHALDGGALVIKLTWR